jgi:hypothetical protein
MAQKTFKIGEYCVGGVIQAIVKGDQVTIISKEWDMSTGCNRGSSQKNAKELGSRTVNSKMNGSYRILNNYLHDLTTSYYADQILKWVKSNGIKFETSFF